MRKFLIGLASVMILALSIYIIIEGAPFVNVNGYKRINELSDELDSEIKKINDIKEKTYVEKENELNNETSNLKDKREEYLAKVEAAKIQGAKTSDLLKDYDLDVIWSRIGTKASKSGVDLKFDVYPGTEEKAHDGLKLYNLHFTVIGDYLNIISFINKIEADSVIATRISDFSLKLSDISGGEEGETTEGEEEEVRETKIALVSEFTFKNVPLNYKKLEENTSTSQPGEDQEKKIEDSSEEKSTEDTDSSILDE